MYKDFYLKKLTENISLTFNVDCTVRKIAIEASKKCGGLQLFSNNETNGKPVKWFCDIHLLIKISSMKPKVSFLTIL